MDRRTFFGGASAGVAGLILPHKTKAAGFESLSNEEMAQIIYDHPDSVSVISDIPIGQTRDYKYVGEWDYMEDHSRTRLKQDRVSEWKTHSDSQLTSRNPYWLPFDGKIKRVINGCVVSTLLYRRYKESESFLRWERRFDISHPALKMIHCCGVDSIDRDFNGRCFARIDGYWREL